MVLKMAKTKSGEIKMLSFGTEGAHFPALLGRKRSNLQICGCPCLRFCAHVVVGPGGILMGGGEYTKRPNQSRTPINISWLH